MVKRYWVTRNIVDVCAKLKTENADHIEEYNDGYGKDDFYIVLANGKYHIVPGCDLSENKETLELYTGVCTNCDKVSPIGNYCIWCGKKGTCLEGGEVE